MIYLFRGGGANVANEDIMLDIGCGWGRWLLSGAKKGYIPVGIDLRLEFCETARKLLAKQGYNGYTLVADLENIPIKDNILEFIWSFSVIQHTHIKRLKNCIKEINRLLTGSGKTKLEFPNKWGLRNALSGNVKDNHRYKDDYDSWSVRYYSPQEYKEMFQQHMQDFSIENHSFLGIGVLKEDIKYLSGREKLLCYMSLLMSSLTKVIPFLIYLSDSIYISAKKYSSSYNISNSLSQFRKKHSADPKNNLNLLEILKCPKYGGQLNLKNNKLVSDEAGIFYPIENNIPILVASEACSISR